MRMQFIMCGAIIFLHAGLRAADSNRTVRETGEILVTAQKQSLPSRETPLSLSVYPAAVLEATPALSLKDVAEWTPNFSYYNPGSRRQALFYIRGQGSSGPNPPAVGVFLDDIYLHKTGFSDLDLHGSESVEILRGPQSTLYGRNTEAGAIKISTLDPEPVANAEIAQSLGNYRFQETRLRAAGPLLNGRLRSSLSGQYRKRDGFSRNDFLQQDADPIEESSGRLAAEWQPAADLTLKGTAYGALDRDGGYALAPLEDVKNDPYHVQHNVPGRHQRDLGVLALDASLIRDGIAWRSLTSYTDWKGWERYDADFSPADILQQQDEESSGIFSQEVRASAGKRGEGVRWLAGGYFEWAPEDGTETRTFGADAGAFGAPSGMVQSTPEERRAWTLAPFARATVAVRTNLDLSAGLRFDYGRNHRTGSIDTAVPGQPVMTQALDDKQIDRQWSPEIGVEYRLAPELMAYGRIARGWRSGGFNTPAADAPSVYDPEYSWAYEVGAKSEWLEKTLQLDASLFYTRIYNQQLIQFNPRGAGFFFENVGDASSLGGEVEARWNMACGFSLRGSAGYTDARYTEAGVAAADVDWTGNRLPYVPAWTYYAALQKDVFLQPDWNLYARLGVGGNTAIDWDEANTVQTPGHALWDARAGVQRRYGALSVWVKNLTGEDYPAVLYVFPGSAPLAQPVDPRTFGVTLELFL